jgi:protease-4
MVRIGLLVHKSIGLWVYRSISLLVCLLVSANMFTGGDACAATSLPRAVLLPSASVAVSDDAMAVVFNPAGLGIERGMNGYYLHTFSGETGGDNALFISLSGFGFGAEFADPGSVEFTKYTLSDGMRLFDSLYLGSSYAWFNSKDDAYDKLSSWDIGLLWRPSGLVSIGLAARNLSRSVFDGADTSRTYDLSFALRPYTNRATFSIDSELQEGRKVKDARITYAMECEPIDGVMLRGSYNNDGNFDIRVGIGFTQFEVGAYNRFDSDRRRDGGVAYARFSSERHRTKFRTGRYFLEVEPGDLVHGRIQDSPLRRAREDKAVDGMILKLGMGGYSMGRVQEMRDAILDFRSSGKKTICYMELAGNKEYYLATACDEIILNSAGYLSLNGLRSEVTFYRGVLDKLGIEADLYHVGKYKSASEMFTRESMSDAYRESLDSFLDDLHDQMVSGIAEGRDISRAEVVKAIDRGPYTAREAMDAGIVDRLVYADQLEEVAEQVFGKNVKTLPGRQYGSRKYHRYDWDINPKLAVIYATGTITPGKSIGRRAESREHRSTGLPIPRIMGSETISGAIKRAREDSSIKAIVLRIDSGGGSVFASDLIWREAMLTKDEKPLIVSMGGMAASGGYYIACPADVIVAEPGTVTGSIGVIAGKFSLRGLYDRLGIKKETLKRGRNSDIYTMYSVFTDEQREIIDRQIREAYDDFARKVAKSRNMTKEAVELIAQGRVWTGRQAKDNGLVDELGSLRLAISIARARAGFEPDESVDIVAFPERMPLWRRFVLGEALLLPESPNLAALLDVMKAAEGLANDRIFFLMPYTLDCE